MSLILERIQRAEGRLRFDLSELMGRVRSGIPRDFADGEQLGNRRRFLRESLGDDSLASLCLERVLGGNELQPVNYFRRGAIAAGAVARICIRQPSGKLHAWGTGFLIAPQVLITNNHVLPGTDLAAQSEAHLEYETSLADQPIGPTIFRLKPQELFFTSKELDFSVVAVAGEAEENHRPLWDFGCLPLLDVPGKSFEGEWLTIIQHPAGERKQVCVRENRLLRREADVLWYSTDTLSGSSGSPVFNNDWYVVALHHSGIPEKRDGRIQTLDGRDFDPETMDESRIKWVANEGIRASRIVQVLRQVHPNHPLLQPLFAATPESARIRSAHSGEQSITSEPANQPKSTAMNSENIRTVTIPLQITLQFNAPAGTVLSAATAGSVMAPESATMLQERTTSGTGRSNRQPAFDVPFESDYSNRKGFDQDFLGGPANRINFPTLSQALEHEAVKLLKPTAKNAHILHYHNFSVVMHQKRRFAIYSAANVSFAQRYDMGRPTDVWREDPRIPLDAQVTNFFYAKNKFDRGHLTRREDLEFGPTPKDALQSAADTCHWTNCTPQHERFNQNKEIWQGIERHVLENAIMANHFKAQFITGPVFDQGDPDYKGIAYPLRYWKVVAALNGSGKLFATAYLASQEQVIGDYGIEAAPEVPFGPFKTFQVPIAEIERLTGLKFTCGASNSSLRDFDPLASVVPTRRRTRPVRPQEAATLALPSGYLELTTLDDIVVG